LLNGTLGSTRSPFFQQFEKKRDQGKTLRALSQTEKSVLSTEFRLREVENKATSRIIFGGLDDFDRFFYGSAGAIRVGGY
jgi:hypothetical protein